MAMQCCMGAMMQCSMGMAPASLLVTSQQAEMSGGMLAATIMDHAPMANIPTNIRYVITFDADTRMSRGAAAQLVGATKIFKAGGAQAIAALAYGTESIPAVNKIFGPGNQYVTKAKQLINLQGTAIDIPAGPSEVLVVAGVQLCRLVEVRMT